MGRKNEFAYGLEILAQSKNEAMIYKIASNFEKATKVYENPEISPTLYEIPEDVTTLLGYYEENQEDTKYKLANDRMKEVLANYEIDDVKIRDLLIKYEYPLLENHVLISENNIKPILYAAIIVLTIIVIALGFKVKKPKKKAA